MKNFIIPFALISSFVFSCSSGKSDKKEITPELIEANEYHQRSLDIREELMQVEKQLKAADIDYTSLKDELKIWDKDIIEVPGFEHSHDDEHQRDYHVHNAMKPFNDKEHLDYQKMMYEEIVNLSEQMKRKLAANLMQEQG